ncbi:MAG: outer membrane protein assembly factor BamD [Rickettsiales bacterium TMED289]|nr:MAG: outer membrane protein assembly factor BamD [Rickettsiales bacterium TMED289]
MNFKILFILFFLIFALNNCSQKKSQVDQIKETNIEEQMRIVYNEGMLELDRGNSLSAAKKFSEAEILFPQSVWAPRSALMTAYSYYSYGYFFDTIDELNRYLKTYPLHNRQSYAYYLLALCYYEQIIDEKKDLEPIISSKKYFNLIIEKYPKSEFASDAKYKMELIDEILASKEMYLGRYYIEKEKWIPAINRFKTVLKDYDKTIYTEEALHRLVEIHYKLGLIEESRKYANLLGYNYQSGEWYLKSYKIFNTDYEKSVLKTPLKKKKKSSLLKKFKSLLE